MLAGGKTWPGWIYRLGPGRVGVTNVCIPILKDKMTLEADVARSDMADREYIEALQRLIVELHGCLSEHVESVRVDENFLGKTLWAGDVEVFSLIGHPRFQRCFAWAFGGHHRRKGERFYAVLGTSVIRNPLDAVKFVRVLNSASLIREFSELRESP